MNANRKIEYDVVYMKMAMDMATLSYARRSKVGCLIVSDDGQLISQGYNGMPSGFPNDCEHFEHNHETGNDELVTNPEVLHAESNAIAKCAKWEAGCDGGTVYVTLSPCLQCAKLILQAGIKRVVYLEQYRDTTPLDFLRNGGVVVEQLDIENNILTRHILSTNYTEQ